MFCRCGQAPRKLPSDSYPRRLPLPRKVENFSTESDAACDGFFEDFDVDADQLCLLLTANLEIIREYLGPKFYVACV